MKILATGKRTSGSWPVRGEQLGAAIGADVIPNAENLRGYDLAIVVKRIQSHLWVALQRSGIPIVWDVVDAWAQPIGNTWDYAACSTWARIQMEVMRPSAVVVSCAAMATDFDYGVPILVLPHHARPGMPINPIRERVQTVGYEGGLHYLGSWRTVLEDECLARGWRFVCNPASLAELDIVVALRDATGYAARRWKSNVKLANAQGSGTPCILSPASAYMETACGAEKWASCAEDIGRAFDELEDCSVRQETARRLWAATPTLENVAEKYKGWLHSL